jgi:peptidyl-prolyl cis-trans isomerase B (cyclophilin B)
VRLRALVGALALLAAAPVLSAQESGTSPGPAERPPRVLLRTVAGDILLTLYPDVAPRHVEQLLKLLRAGVYDGTHFFRVQPDFVIQLGNAQDRLRPLSPEQSALIRPIPAELSDRIHRPGALSMARRGDDPDSAETSFSILLDFAPHLDGRYTVFGHVERGVEVLQELLEVPRDARFRPVQRLTVISAGVVRPEVPSEQVPLAAARPVRPGPDAPIRAESRVPDAAERPTFIAAISVMALVSLLGFFTAGRSARRLPTALSLINVLVGLFFLLALLTPLSQERSWLALLLFAAVLGVLKLLGRFERSGGA